MVCMTKSERSNIAWDTPQAGPNTTTPDGDSGAVLYHLTSTNRFVEYTRPINILETVIFRPLAVDPQTDHYPEAICVRASSAGPIEITFNGWDDISQDLQATARVRRTWKPQTTAP